MSEPNVTETEERGSIVWHAVYRVPKKNHDAMVQVCKQFNEMFKKYGGLRIEVFQLANTNVPTEGIINIANTVSANQEKKFGWNYNTTEIRDTWMKSAQNWERMKIWGEIIKSLWIY